VNVFWYGIDSFATIVSTLIRIGLTGWAISKYFEGFTISTDVESAEYWLNIFGVIFLFIAEFTYMYKLVPAFIGISEFLPSDL
jgi:hypothetical protein